MRCFVAIPLDAGVRRDLSRLIRSLPSAAGDLKPCGDQQLHITLKFLGELADRDLPRACDIVKLTCAVFAPFWLTIGGLGVFPEAGSPRVLWVGVDDPGRVCGEWVKAADPLFAELGVDPERRAFSPHVTLARSRSGRGGRLIGDWLKSSPAMPPATITVDHVILFESRLDRGGPRYTPMATAPLAASH